MTAFDEARARLEADIRAGISTGTAPRITAGDLTDDQISWLATWLAGRGYDRQDTSKPDAEAVLDGIKPQAGHDYDTPSYATAGFELLDEAIGTLRSDWNYGNGSITSNNGAEPFENDVFALRAFCWCDGEDHDGADCPPNFEHKATGVTAQWYKHARRGRLINHPLTLAQWERIQADCLASLGITLADIDTRREAETASCTRCQKTRADFTAEDADSVRHRGMCWRCAYDSYVEFSAEMAALMGEDDGA